MRYGWTVLLLGAWIFAAEGGAAERVCDDLHYDGKRIIGEAEWVQLPRQGLKLRGRIDTGATTTSIDAREIRVQERDGRKWVLFDLVERESDRKIHLEKPVVRIASIKRHGAEDQERPVVKLRLRIGETERYVEVSLTDRSRYEYPVLIGRNFLRGEFVVDVSRAYAADSGAKNGKEKR
jgi:hypothetical protein